MTFCPALEVAAEPREYKTVARPRIGQVQVTIRLKGAIRLFKFRKFRRVFVVDKRFVPSQTSVAAALHSNDMASNVCCLIFSGVSDLFDREDCFRQKVCIVMMQKKAGKI